MGFFCSYLFRRCLEGKVALMKWFRVNKIDGIFQENMGAVCRVGAPKEV